MFIVFAIIIGILVIVLLKLLGKKKEPIIDPDIPVVTYKVDFQKELERIYNENVPNSPGPSDNRTLNEMNRDRLIDRLACDISYVASILTSLNNDSRPYPTTVLTEIKKASEVHGRILKSRRKDYLGEAVSLAKKNVDDPEIIKTIDTYSANPKLLNLDAFKISLFDKYFLNYKDYWERQIAELKRSSAIIARRKYLMEKCTEWKEFLKEQGIEKYDMVLDEYYNYNLAKLNR